MRASSFEIDRNHVRESRAHAAAREPRVAEFDVPGDRSPVPGPDAQSRASALCAGATIPSGHSVHVDAEAFVRTPEIADAQQIARTMNDSWRVGYRGLLSDAILDGLDDARGTTQWV